jgi:RNA polymerase-binding transcription factor DksA
LHALLKENPVDLDAIRADLEQVVREADAVILTLELDQEEDELEVVEDPEDLATETIEAERDEALLESAQARRADAVRALARLDEGTYGKCIDCGEEIAKARLEFRPEAARCLPCQEKFEDSEG